ncbi:MAG: hypothetical protein ACK5MZ_07325 [Aestuariibaculum sp.]
MLKYTFLLVLCLGFGSIWAQDTTVQQVETTQDSLKKALLIKHLGNGYFPTKYFNFDLRYVFKFNQYEGIRTGIGGVTNNRLSKIFKINGYTVFGFRDSKLKYSIGGSLRLSETSKTWLSATYTDDLQETGSTKFITDKRLFQFFEPRLLNISMFHRHITKSTALDFQLSNHLISGTEFAISNIDPTYNYSFITDNKTFHSFHTAIAKFALQWSPFSTFENTENGTSVETKNGYPKFTIQYSKNFKNAFKSEFNFSKIDFRTIYRFAQNKERYSEAVLVGGYANGNVPLTHLYHAYPNNINKATVLRRFSVAGNNSFETMFFNEFFSDRFFTFQFKQYVKPFEISERFKPQIVLTTRYALGNMSNIQRHQGVTFNTLNKGYTESGIEINKLLFGFGLSFTYRYGAYHLPKTDDNIALKFTFNVTL